MREQKRKPREGRDAALADLATRQHGVVSARQLARLGFSSSAVDRVVARGRLQRMHRGVYLVGHARTDWNCRCMGAVLAAEPAVASHFSAAWLWGLLKSRPGTIHLTVPSRRHARRGFVVHRSPLAPADKAERDGIPVTALARTYLDLGAVCADDRLQRFLERGEELRIFDLREVDAALELDAYWERERFGVELDAFATHGSRAAFERDRLREDDLQMLGIETMRVTEARLDREPEAMVRRVAAHLKRRRRELGRWPLRLPAGG